MHKFIRLKMPDTLQQNAAKQEQQEITVIILLVCFSNILEMQNSAHGNNTPRKYNFVNLWQLICNNVIKVRLEKEEKSLNMISSYSFMY